MAGSLASSLHSSALHGDVTTLLHHARTHCERLLAAFIQYGAAHVDTEQCGGTALLPAPLLLLPHLGAASGTRAALHDGVLAGVLSHVDPARDVDLFAPLWLAITGRLRAMCLLDDFLPPLRAATTLIQV